MLATDRFFSIFKTAARGLQAQRIALGTTSENIANATTTRTADGGPYALKRTVHELPREQNNLFGSIMEDMKTQATVTDSRHVSGSLIRYQLPEMEMGPLTEVQDVMRLRAEFDPTHPHADAEGYVQYPDINIVEEMSRMISANRIYEANLSTVQAAKEMIKQTLEI